MVIKFTNNGIRFTFNIPAGEEGESPPSPIERRKLGLPTGGKLGLSTGKRGKGKGIKLASVENSIKDSSKEGE